MAKFQIFTDTASDMWPELRKEYGIDYFQMGLVINGKEIKADLDFHNLSYEDQYNIVRDPKNVIKTSLVKAEEFNEKCEKYLSQGIDILYIACTSVLSGTLNFFRLCAEELQAKYPERKIISMDSTRAGMTLGLMVIDAAKLQKEGKSIE